LSSFTEFSNYAINREYELKSGILLKKSVQYTCQAIASHNIKYLRSVTFNGEGYNIFDLVAFPFENCTLPILGIDYVTLPGV
jgi:hypothetical protein